MGQQQDEHTPDHSGTRYRALFANMTEGFAFGEVICGEDGSPRDVRFIEVNDAFEIQSGLARDAVCGRPMREVLPNLEQSWIDIYGGVALGAPARRFESYSADLDRHFSVYCFSPRHGQFAILFTDITESKHNEAAHRAMAETFRQLVEHSPFGVYVVDADFRLVQVSAGAQKVFANVRPLLGRDFAEVLRCIWPEPFASEAIGHFRRTLDTGEPYHAPSTVERRSDIDAVESYDWKIERVVLPDGRFGVVCHFYDLSERQQYEAALQAKTQQLESLLTNAPLGVAFFDREHRYVQVNEDLAAMNGIPAADHVGRTVEALLPRNAEAVVPVLDRVFATGEPVRNFEVAGETPREPGVPRHWLTGFYPVRDDKGTVVLVGAWVAEISESKRAEQALRDADRRKNEFLAVLSHELRNPLAPIRTGVYLLEHAATGPEQAARVREVIRRQVEHLARLVDDLLDVTRISRGKVDLQRELLDLRDTVRETTDDLRSLFQQSQVDLRIELVPGPLRVDADPARISQVLGNLLQNSLKFTPAGGLVTVSLATTTGGFAELSVCDTGVGIETGEVDRMFEPFVQAANSLARTEGGLGLGLALVKGLVELHGGFVEAQSQGPGTGTRVVVRLPLSSGDAASKADAPAAVGAGRRIVVVIEDNRDAAQTLADLLALHGHDVRLAHDGTSGLALARELGADAVLCDIGLPDMDGYAVARALRADARTRPIRLVALSGYAQPEERRRAREAGFDLHIAKPPRPRDVLAAIAAG
jgi:PAS domain S-box-containing protein